MKNRVHLHGGKFKLSLGIYDSCGACTRTMGYVAAVCPRRCSGDALIASGARECGAQEDDAGLQRASGRSAQLFLTSREARLSIDMLYEQDAVIPNAEGSENSVDIQTTLLSVTIQTRNLATNHFVARTRPSCWRSCCGILMGQLDLCYSNASDNASSIRDQLVLQPRTNFGRHRALHHCGASDLPQERHVFAATRR